MVDHQGTLTIPRGSLAGLLGEVLRKGAEFRFRASGTSMWPIIKDGDKLTIAPLSPDETRNGQVVAIVKDSTDHVYVHRIVDVQRDGVVTKGDNQQTYDPKADFDEIVGRVVQVHRGIFPVPFGLTSLHLMTGVRRVRRTLKQLFYKRVTKW